MTKVIGIGLNAAILDLLSAGATFFLCACVRACVCVCVCVWGGNIPLGHLEAEVSELGGGAGGHGPPLLEEGGPEYYLAPRKQI